MNERLMQYAVLKVLVVFITANITSKRQFGFAWFYSLGKIMLLLFKRLLQAFFKPQDMEDTNFAHKVALCARTNFSYPLH